MDDQDLVFVDLDPKVSSIQEDVEEGTEARTPRKTAGFEWAAEPDEYLFPCCATKFVMLGISIFLSLISVVAWIVSSYYGGFVWLVVATLFMSLIIFLPEYFCNIVNFAVSFCLWVAFTFFCLIYGIKHLVDRGRENLHPITRKQLSDAAIFEFIECLISLLVVLLMFRMLYWFYINRKGGGECIAASD
uniref:MARVEL domain-containing protein n=1 Tax=Caenorhabditis tropicalis TaxID=1561998 RepID=A0A1I7UNZ5_9PELO